MQSVSRTRARHLRMWHFWPACALLAMLMTALVALNVDAARSGVSDGYNCVRLLGSQPDTGWLVDLSTGFVVPDTRPLARQSGSLPPVTDSWPSPDGSQIAYVRQAGGDLLSVRPAPAHGFVDEVGARHIDTLPLLLALSWSADGRRLAYLWLDETGIPVLTMSAPDGSARHDRHLITPDPHSPRLLGWAADGSAVALYMAGLSGPQITLWADEEIERPAPNIAASVAAPDDEIAVWAPAGHRLAFIRRSGADGGASGLPSELVVVRPDADGLTTQTAELPAVANVSLEWSPGGHALAVRLADRGGTQIRVFQVRDTGLAEIARLAQGTLWPQTMFWAPSEAESAAGASQETLFFWQQQGPTRNLARLIVEVEHGETVLENVYENVVLPRAGEIDPLSAARRHVSHHIAVAWRNAQGSIDVDLMDTRLLERTALVREARDIYRVDWSPGGEIIVVRWEIQRGMEGRGQLTWARADGSDLHILDDYNPAIAAMLWIRENRAIVYVAERAGTFYVEQVNLVTNERTILSDYLMEVEHFGLDETNGHIQFWWRSGRRQAGYDLFSPFGVRVVRYLSATGVIDNGHLLQAPIGPLAIILSGPQTAVTLQVASGDGLLAYVAEPAAGNLVTLLERIAWSPDAARFAYSLPEGDGETLRVYTVLAQVVDLVSTIAIPGPVAGAPLWTQCG